MLYCSVWCDQIVDCGYGIIVTNIPTLWPTWRSRIATGWRPLEEEERWLHQKLDDSSGPPRALSGSRSIYSIHHRTPYFWRFHQTFHFKSIEVVYMTSGGSTYLNLYEYPLESPSHHTPDFILKHAPPGVTGNTLKATKLVVTVQAWIES